MSIYSAKKFITRNVVMLIIPIIFVVLKLFFLQPSGMYQNYNYNEITLSRVVESPLRLLESVYSSVLYPINLSIDYAVSNILIIVLILTLLNRSYLFSDGLFSTKNLLKIDRLNIIKPSILILFFGVLAYILVGKTPSLDNWNSRHQILVPVGSSFLLLYFFIKIILAIQSVRLRRIIALFPVAIFIVFNINIYFSYIIDWYKQVSFIEHIKSNDITNSGSTFLVVDNTKNLNAINRGKSFIDYTGFLKKELNRQDNFIEEVENYSINNISEYLQYKEDGFYGINDWIPTGPEFVITVDYGSYKIDNIVVIKMIVNHLIKPEKNLKNIKNILKVKVEKIGDK